MSRVSALVFFLCVVLFDKYAGSNLIRAAGDEDIRTKEVQNDPTAPVEVISQIVMDSSPSSSVDVAPSSSLPIHVASSPSSSVDVMASSPDVTAKECAKIGDFCMSHSDCCTYACLGYMKRCVSGSG